MLKVKIIRITYLCISLTMGYLSLAQVSKPSTVSIYPNVGDSLFGLVDNLPSHIELGPSGENHLWNFVSLQSPFVRRYGYSAVSENLIELKKEDYTLQYKKIDGDLYLTAILGVDLLLVGATIDLYAYPSLLAFDNPIRYQDASSNYSRLIGYSLGSAIPTEHRPASVHKEDSIRYVIELFRDDVVDASGTLLLQNEAHDVLRMRRAEDRTIRVFVTDHKGGWIEITNYLKTRLKGIQWSGETYTYLFLSDEVPGPLAIVETKEYDGSPIRVTYSADPKMAQHISLNESLNGTYAYPNPTFGFVRFEFFNLPFGEYRLALYNLLGKEVWAEEILIDDLNQVVTANLSSLRRGTYFYSLQNETGKRISTRRLVIIKP